MSAPDGSHAYCRDLIERADEDFHLSLPYARAEDRARLAAFFAFAIELRRIPHAVSEAPLGEIRLQWWRDALLEIAEDRGARAHPVVQALKESGAVTPAFRTAAERMIDARARLLYEPTFATLADLKAFLADAEAAVAVIAHGDLENAAVGRAGEAYSLARFAPILAPSLAGDAAASATASFQAAASSLGALSPAKAGSVAFLALTRGHAARPDARRWPVAKRLALFGAVLTGRF